MMALNDTITNVTRRYHANGNLRFEESFYNNGKSTTKLWDVSGRLKFRRLYVDGVQHGTSIAIEYIDNSTLRYSIQDYDIGLLHGRDFSFVTFDTLRVKYYNKGCKVSKENCLNELPAVYPRTLSNNYLNGDLHFECKFVDIDSFSFVEFHPNGQLKFSGKFVNAMPYKHFICYNDSGDITCDIGHTNGLRQGPIGATDSDGNWEIRFALYGDAVTEDEYRRHELIHKLSGLE